MDLRPRFAGGDASSRADVDLLGSRLCGKSSLSSAAACEARVRFLPLAGVASSFLIAGELLLFLDARFSVGVAGGLESCCGSSACLPRVVAEADDRVARAMTVVVFGRVESVYQGDTIFENLLTALDARQIVSRMMGESVRCSKK